MLELNVGTVYAYKKPRVNESSHLKMNQNVLHFLPSVIGRGVFQCNSVSLQQDRNLKNERYLYGTNTICNAVTGNTSYSIFQLIPCHHIYSHQYLNDNSKMH